VHQGFAQHKEVERIRQLVALYVSPPVAAGVFALDEKPQIQAR
jgi:hypothetical protein